MSFAGMNYWAVVAAAAASFLFGGVYYGVLSKPWMAAVGRTEEDIKAAGRSLPMLFLLTIIAQLVMAWVLAGLISHLGPGQVTVRNGIISGAFAWLGFVVTTLLVNHAYQGARRELTMIDGAHWFGVLVIQGAIIGWLGVR